MLVLFNALFGDNTVETPARPVADEPVLHGRLAAFTAVSAPRTPTSPTWCRSGARRACSSGGGARRCRRGSTSPASSARPSCSPRRAPRSCSTIGVLAYDLQIEAAKVPAMVVTFLVGVCSFSALGLAVAGARAQRPFGVGGGQRHDPAAGVHLQRLHPARGSRRSGSRRSATSSRSSRSRSASRTRSTRSCRRRHSTGTSSHSSRSGASPARSWQCVTSGGSRRRARRRPRRRRASRAQASA